MAQIKLSAMQWPAARKEREADEHLTAANIVEKYDAHWRLGEAA